LSVIRPFDPWRSPLCTCPLKWTVNPYTGCAHGCAYCYATSYIKNRFNPKPKELLITRARRDLKKIPRGALIDMSSSSDPYTPPENVYRLTRQLIHEVLSHSMRLLITTKSSLVTRDIDLLSKHLGRVAVAITITTIDDYTARRIEPGAPTPAERIEAVRMLSRAGIPVTVRVDPVIPNVNDDYDMLRELIRRVAEAGALQVTTSTYKAKLDNLARMKRALPHLAEAFDELYRVRGVRIHGYMYLEEKLRFSYMKMVKEIAEEFGLVFATCREGFPHLHTPGFYCDGSSYTIPEVYEQIRRL